jgi:hypothetical protein
MWVLGFNAAVEAAPTDEDANNYCRILALLGMEEEGDPVEAVRKLLAAKEPQ